MGDQGGQTAYRVSLTAIVAMTLVGALVGGVMLVTRAQDAARAPQVDFAIGPGPGVVTLRALDEVGDRPFMAPFAVDLALDPVRLILQPRNAVAAESTSRRGSDADLLVANSLVPRLVAVRDAGGALDVGLVRDVADQAIGALGSIDGLLDADRDGFDDDGRFGITALDGSAVCVTLGERRALATALSLAIDPIDDRPSSGIGWTPHGPCGSTSVPPTGTEVRVGTTPGTYGGVRSGEVCDVDRLVSQLRANPLVAQSWVAVHSIDLELLDAFVGALTPVVLLRDTLVTEHGFDNGRTHPSQVVLQRGTSVMVDRTGQPRVRCMSGAPLGPPQAAMSDSVVVIGEPWRGFSIDGVTDVPAAEVAASRIVLVDIRSGQPIVRDTDGGPSALAGPVIGALGGG
jgi:hypothetical protein